MSYKQYMSHWKNHRKDSKRQQCGFSMKDEGIKAAAVIAEETAESYHIREIKSDKIVSKNFETSDEAVDFLRTLPSNVWYGVYTDKGFCVSR